MWRNLKWLRAIPLILIIITCLGLGSVYATDVHFDDNIEKINSYITLESGVLTLSRWNGEVSLSFGLPIHPQTTISSNSELIELIYADNIRAQIYRVPEGLEYLVIFDKKINHIRYSFPISDAGLTWFIQPPLTDDYSGGYNEEFKQIITVNATHVVGEDGSILSYRPLNVVGSYAVYYSKTGN